MKTFIKVAILIMGLCSSAYAQLINCNPDPNGDPWYGGRIEEITPEFLQWVDSIPELVPTPESEMTILPSMVDNTTKPYFPAIKDQGDVLMCVQMATVYYTFTYEINRLNGITSEEERIDYHPSFIYNFLNEGSNLNGTEIDETFDILQQTGCPSVGTYGTPVPNQDPTMWLTGYDKYEEILRHRLDFCEKISNIDTYDGRNTLKHWLYDHGEGDENNGGIAVFLIQDLWGLGYAEVSDTNYPTNTWFINSIDNVHNVGHAMTIVGYDDSIDLGFYGHGALKIANSEGLNWPAEDAGGTGYLPYSLLSDEDLFLGGNLVYVLHVIKPELELCFKTKVSAEDRNNLS